MIRLIATLIWTQLQTSPHAIITISYIVNKDRAMNTVQNFQIKSPPHFADAVHLTQSELDQQILLMAALKMFELGKISSGKAGELAGMSRVEFLEKCGQYKVSIFNYDDEIIELQVDALKIPKNLKILIR